jgi:hypothetical protein
MVKPDELLCKLGFLGISSNICHAPFAVDHTNKRDRLLASQWAMNIVFHVLIGLLFAKLCGVRSLPGVAMGVIFSVLPDIDHIPHLKKDLRTGRFGVDTRSSLHELLGLAFILSGSLIVSVAIPNLFRCTLSPQGRSILNYIREG